ncbi:hypothetical protein AB0H96_54285 [Nonomuraea fuscirosea]
MIYFANGVSWDWQGPFPFDLFDAPLAGAVVDSDDPARLLAAEALIHKPEVFLPLTGQLLTALRASDLADFELRRTPQAGVLRRPLEGRLPWGKVRFPEGWVMQHGLFKDRLTRASQGGILSPLLANIALTALNEHFHS